MQNQGRLQCLKARDEHVKSVLNEARSNLSKISADRNRYPPILKGLILQVFWRLNKRNLKKIKFYSKHLKNLHYLIINLNFSTISTNISQTI